MREILFKAIEDETGEWVVGSLLQSSPFKTGWVDSWIKPKVPMVLGSWSTPTSLFHQVKDGTVCQFTGKLDDSAKKVFEGDEAAIFGLCYYSNNQFNIEPTSSSCWMLKGTVKMDNHMWVVEFADKTCIPFCDIENEDMSIMLTGRNVQDGGQDED